MSDDQALSTTVSSNHIDLAIAGWLDAHSRSPKTLKAYIDTINQFRFELRRIRHDLDSNIRTLAMVAQRYASKRYPTIDKETGKVIRMERTEPIKQSTRNARLAILSSFYEYALARYLLAPMDDQGHIANPLKIVTREKIEPYQGIHWLGPEEAQAALNKIDRSTDIGKRDYALLVVFLTTGRRLKEVASLQWRHVHFKGQRVTLTFEHCKRDKTMIDTLNVGNSKALLQWLHAYYGSDLASLDKHAPLWVTLSRNTEQAGKPLGIQGIQQVCGKYLEAHTHITRHTFSQLMMRAGATLPELQARLGHESLATTGMYARALSSDENPHADKIAAMLGIESGDTAMSQEPTITPDSVSNYSHLKEPFRSDWIRCIICKQVPAEIVYHVRIPALSIGASCCSQECAELWMKSEVRIARRTPIDYHEEDYEDSTPPTQAMRSGWMYARRKQGTYPGDTERSGKWLIWLSAETVDRYWQKIKEAVEQGHLGNAAKVATAGSGRQKAGKPYVICVYTYDYEDKADVMHTRSVLSDLGIRREIIYKADEDTHRLRYGSDYTPKYRA